MFTLKLAAGTLLVAMLCYLVLRWTRSRRLRADVSRNPFLHDRGVHLPRPLRRLSAHRAVAVPRPGGPGRDRAMSATNAAAVRLAARARRERHAGHQSPQPGVHPGEQSARALSARRRQDDHQRRSATRTAFRCRRRTPSFAATATCGGFMELIGDRSEFVVKPASGSAGRGIIVIARRKGNDFETPSGRVSVAGRPPVSPVDDSLRPVFARRAGR